VVKKFVALSLMMAALLYAQDQTPVFRATSELVLVDVQVLHRKTGAPAPALRVADFQFSEEGAPQRIVHFSRDELPLSVVLLFDLTDSVRGVLKRLAEAAKSALEHFKGAATMTSNQPAYFNEAVYQAAVELRQAGSPLNRRVIVWLTDNLPNVPHRKDDPPHTEAEALRALQEDGVVVAPILLKSPLWVVLGPLVRAGEAAHEKSFPGGRCPKIRGMDGRPGLRSGEPPAPPCALFLDARKSCLFAIEVISFQ
jgi:hypothetical protein